MEKYIPYEKLSKKEKRELNRKKRSSWGCVNPVTRKVESKKVYNRKKFSVDEKFLTNISKSSSLLE